MKRAIIITIAVIVALAALAGLKVQEGLAYDDQGNATSPLLCPPSLPTTDPQFPGNLLPLTFNVPQGTWDPYHSGVGGWVATSSLIPFTVSTLALTPLIQPVLVGQGWYVPGQTYTSYSGMDYQWEGPGTGPPGAFALCFKKEWLWGLIWNNYIYFPGDPAHLYGYAFNLSIADNGSCGGGDDGGDSGTITDEAAYRRVPSQHAGSSRSGLAPPAKPSFDCSSDDGADPTDPSGGDATGGGSDCYTDTVEIQVENADGGWDTIYDGDATICEYADARRPTSTRTANR